MTTNSWRFYEFGPFRIDVIDRLLLRDGEVVPLPPKAFEALLILVESGGRVLSKKDLMEALWPDSHVEEANLSHNIYKLREALREKQEGQRYIETLAKRGYRFVAPTTAIPTSAPADNLVSIDQSKTSSVNGAGAPPSQANHGESEVLTTADPVIASFEPNLRSATGRQRVFRNILIVSGSAILAILIAGYFWAKHATPTIASTNQIRSLAILPFKPLSTESHDEALELGMADALITKLSNVKQVVVRPTSSVLKYAHSEEDLLAVGREQGVDAVVEGRMQKAGDRIRFTVNITRVSDGVPIWAGTFDDRLTNVFAVQDEISEQMAQALVSQLTGIEHQQIAKHYTESIEAYQLYSEGRVHWYKFSPEGAEKSISYYNQAIALDPNYALAYAGLSFSYSVQGAIGSVHPVEAYLKSKGAAETAVKLDDTLAEGHVALGGKSLFFERDWFNARKEFERAIELNPNFADAHELLGYYWEVVQQYDKAEAELRNAQRIAPLMGLVNADVAALAYYQHHYDEALNLSRKAQKLDPDFVPVPFIVAQIFERKGEYDGAIDECRKALVLSPDEPGILTELGYSYARAGRKDDAQVILDKLIQTRKQHFISPFMIALLYTSLDKKDDAIDWLNKAYDERDPQLTWVNLDPQLDSLHSDPRFAELLKRMGIFR